MKTKELTKVTCYHCGDPCVDEHRVHDGKDFCCNGCMVVYDLLNEAGLCDYYALEEKPGVKQRSAIDEQRTELFELPEVRERIVEFSEEGITRARFHVPQMHCSSCIWLLENLNRIEPNVLRSRVSFTNKELTITFRETNFPLPKLVALLRRIGYGPQLTASSGTDKQALVPRMLYIRLGVAGFIFGNTMLLSFPEYLGADTEAGLKSGFQWLIVLFSFPVVFFLSTDFFRSAWAGIRTKQVNIDQPIALGIVALWSRSLWEVIASVGPGYFDSLAGLLFFLLIGRWYQAYTYKALRFDRALEDFLPLLVLRKTATGEVAVRVADLIPGDRIMIRDQELVPVDAILCEGTGHIDNSFITGEPQPSRKQFGDTIKAGGRQRGAAIELEVLRTFNDSRLKKLWEEQSSLQDRPAMPKLIDTVARRFTIGVLLVAVGAGLFWWGKDPAQVWLVVTAVLIVACPCALALSMPFAYGHTIRLMGKRGLFLRDIEVVERMAHADTVVFDKTGTLTAREAHEVVWVNDALVVALVLSDDEKALVKSLARNSTHPLSAVLFKEIKGEIVDVIDVEEHVGQGIAGNVNGIPVRIGSAAFCGGKELPRGNGDAHVHITLGGVHRGYYVIRKRARSGIVNAVHELRKTMRVALLTGDASVDAELTHAFANATVVTSCTPVDKGQAIIAEQQNGHRVVMVGDGLNDAGALAQSDVGITVTETTAALTPASDAIMDANALEQLPHFLLMARRARRIVIASLIISLCYNITGVAFAISGQLTPLFAAILMPLSSVTVVAFVSVAVWLGARR
ncbi:MAG: heavy metal translocating P-type ATPase [Flavobacteriales bacterium]|nr:heavy metal translocating P-type ATPase [Flavobacteriales bacterium]MBK6945672.1 heavy metal translocating P-type ATPase [Flavobacteriales bacterium]MBK7241777.1 heavy metal translocating P-type ATPase [Flavobacteriales bacterium]MBK9534775.1 heavy metal translocating P-type ATPase [Flavobacteriales bacterium]MBP9137753.1 heavy metal translocating P-type ATPase [Flavobacteriales bacterium]